MSPEGTDPLRLTLSRDAVVAALNCLAACARDEREPERYRSWYREAETELRAAYEGRQ